MQIDFFSVIFAIVNFLVLLFVMYFAMYKPLAKTMKLRQDNIKNNIESAQSLKADAETMKAEISAELTKSREAAQEIITRAEKTGEMQKNEIVAEAKSEANKLIEKAHREVQDEKEKALVEIRNEAASLAMMAASKLINRSLTDADHKQLVDKYIEEAGELQ
ncbi:MAG: F0F1 ATP synthase subunit B [Clostridiales bacterium]